MKNKDKKYWFWRSVCISSVIFGCIVLGIAGVAKAFEGISKTAFYEQQSAIEITENEIIILGQRFEF